MSINIINHFPGKVLGIDPSGSLYIARRFDIIKSRDQGISWEHCWTIPESGWKAKCAVIRPVARLLRQEVRTFCLLSDDTGIAVTKSGIWRGKPGQSRMAFVMKPPDGTPLNIVADTQDRIFFGDYGYTGTKRIYASMNTGRSFEEIYRFKERDIRHVHGIQEDPYEGGYWVFVGDFDEQPGIAKLSQDLKNLDWIERGSQMVRVVKAIIEPDCLYYGTDSEFEQNHIVRLDKKTGKRESLLPIPGASLYATRFGGLRVIATSADGTAYSEPFSTLYVSEADLTCGDREKKGGGRSEWKPLCRYAKDFLPPKYFQYGTCVLPNGVSETSWGAFSGIALKGLDDRTVVFERQREEVDFA